MRSIRFENSVTIAARFENGKFSNARIERISNRNCDIVLESNRARIKRISNRIAIVTGFSNRARIERESSSNRNCDRRLTYATIYILIRMYRK